jgi:hypothetical protein
MSDLAGFTAETKTAGENEETAHPEYCVQDSTGILHPFSIERHCKFADGLRNF